MNDMNRYSKRITQPKSQGASQAMLYATGLGENDMNKAQVGVVSNWLAGNPCNMHLHDFGLKAKQSLEDAGLLGMSFNTVGVSDGISMGTDGMNYSLQSREVIADSIETVVAGQWYDGLVAIPGCDKNMPAALIAMARLNRPGMIVYGGTIAPGCSRDNKDLDIVSAFQSYGQFISGEIDDDQRQDIVKRACPGPGACGGMYTANTMACAIEALGMCVPASSSNPATSNAKKQELAGVGDVMRRLLEQDIKPRDIMTSTALRNAIVTIMALGGSTNAVLHLLAVAHALDLPLSLKDFQAISDEVPLVADLKPSGKYVMADLHQVGGTPGVMKRLLSHGLIDGSCLTVTGKTHEENLAEQESLSPGQKVIVDMNQPLAPKAHIKILRGNLAPEGAVAKITGKEGLRFEGKAIVFDCEEDMLTALEQGEIRKGHAVVIRYEGPRGGPGMPEMLTPTSAIVGAGLHRDVALITDGRFSGGSHGFIIGHVCPEAQDGGPIALIETGDPVTIDAESLEIHVDLTDKQWLERRNRWQEPSLKVRRGTLWKYTRLVSPASQGCVTDA
ncbi:dihydroxy-acid dehydratase [Pseudobacteriovorax antillogorgiicola]|uniref:Dihydroxy-acid dehydratase n=1 Tax=Pseudobacteriovorax antillogorgiicola TaxID=1513793 RepID=A0A1Y6BKF1_9BACT|nr:dihydroxy-acid dehydratase [Pseudobacteriovorax antillogorgiicola]TCS55339.1 dihydroxy-acid dehydratase [Pseudobacteriovorax antillogorgiicola]SMF13981.1 dihydroxy-acid dehydratase [Pseudobacteriovorax antillogorgiicola]